MLYRVDSPQARRRMTTSKSGPADPPSQSQGVAETHDAPTSGAGAETRSDETKRAPASAVRSAREEHDHTPNSRDEDGRDGEDEDEHDDGPRRPGPRTPARESADAPGARRESRRGAQKPWGHLVPPTLRFIAAIALLDATVNVRYPLEEPAFWYLI